MERLINIALLGGIVALLLLQLCRQPATTPQANTVHTEKILIYDSTRKSVAAVAPPVAATKTIEIPADVDTAAILRQYFAQHSYTQTFHDENIRATVLTTVSLNRLEHQTLDYKWLKLIETITSTTTTPPPQSTKAALMLGGFAGATALKEPYGPNAELGGRIGLMTPNELVITYDYDFLGKGHRVGAAKTLRWRK